MGGPKKRIAHIAQVTDLETVASVGHAYRGHDLQHVFQELQTSGRLHRSSVEDSRLRPCHGQQLVVVNIVIKNFSIRKKFLAPSGRYVRSHFTDLTYVV